ncbi:exo-alpha-sialidase [Aeoliella sp.]|uniref:exo-alpha-sialidase n=1 Tax=Aeoliella sp. TaxID=2795800 RepID=UPI003CCB80B5
MASLLAIGTTDAHAEFVKRLVFESGTEGYNIYRIPTIVQAANGDLLAFAEARSGGDASEIDIVMKRSTNNGDSWGTLQVVVENNNYRGWDGLPLTNVTAGNQTPVVDHLDPQNPGRIWMPFTLENDRVFVTYSDDHGATWEFDANGRAREITADVKLPSWGWYATGPVHGIQLTRGEDAGRLIIPSDHRADGWGSHVVYSDDHGVTWELGAVDTRSAEDPAHPNENVATELVDGRVYFNARDQHGTSEGNRVIAYSSDGGESYDSPFAPAPEFVTPVVQNSVIRFRSVDTGDSENILIHSGPGQADSRNDMTISVSYNESESWGKRTLIHAGPSAYSDLVKIDSDHFGVLWEAGDSLYEEILFGYMSIDDLDPTAFNGIDGDVNQDGIVNIDDLNHFIDVWEPYSDKQFLGGVDNYTNGDLNFDNTQNIYDAALLRQYLLNAGVPTDGLQALFQPIPEPSAVVLSAIGGCYLLRGRLAPRTSLISDIFGSAVDNSTTAPGQLGTR